MTRSITCDVCDKADDIGQSDLYFVLQIPHVNLEGDEPITEDPLIVDVCSVECMKTVVESLDRDQIPLSPASAEERMVETTTLEDEVPTFVAVPGPNGTFVPGVPPRARFIPVSPSRVAPPNKLKEGDLDDFYDPGPHVTYEGEVTVDGQRQRPI